MSEFFLLYVVLVLSLSYGTHGRSHESLAFYLRDSSCLDELDTYSLQVAPLAFTERCVTLKPFLSDFSVHHSERFGAAEGLMANPIVLASFKDELFQTGWGTLDIATNSKFPDRIQALVAGYAEGFLTATHIYPTALNAFRALFKPLNLSQAEKFPSMRNGKSLKNCEVNVNDVSNTCDFKLPEKLEIFLLDQDKWTRKMTTKYAPIDDYFFHVFLLQTQLDGLIAGYEAKRQELLKESSFSKSKKVALSKLDRWVFLMLNAYGDFNDLVPALVLSKELSYEQARFQSKVPENTGCSALIKLLPGNEDLFMGHSTWLSYSMTDRVFKHYTLNYNNKATVAKSISFSSYFGLLESMDDYYLLSSNISWTQTSNEVLNYTMYHINNNIKPQSLLAWQRVRVSSALAKNGPHFYELMKNNFSGTYANQYIIVDYNKFVPGKPLQPNTLFIIEEMPGLIVGKDFTNVLTYGYFPSYNIPVFEEVYKASGYQYMFEKYGNKFSYSLYSRAEIFRRDQDSVTDLESFKSILRYNDFESDFYSFDGTEQNPTSTLCSRGDLISSKHSFGEKLVKPYIHGCTDTKVTSFKYGALNLKSQIVNGPTSKSSDRKNNLKDFAWSERGGLFEDWPHIQLPEKYNFTFIETQPRKFGGVRKEAGTKYLRLNLF